MKSSTFILLFVHAADLGKTCQRCHQGRAPVDPDVERKQPQTGSSFQTLLNLSID